MKKYISVFIIAALLFTIFAGTGGTAYAAPGEATISLNQNTVTVKAGEEIKITATVTNKTASAFDGVRVTCAGAFFESSESLEPNATRNITVKFNATEAMLDNTMTLTAEYKVGSNWSEGDSANLQIKKKEDKISIDCSVSVSPGKLVDENTQVTFSFKIKNEGDVKVEDVKVFAPQLGSKALNNGATIEPGKETTIHYDYKVTKAITVKPEIEFSVGGAKQPKYTGTKPVEIKLATRQVDVYLSADNPNPEPGQEVTFTLRVENNGNVPYTGLAVTWNGQEMEFPTTKLAAGKEYEQKYTETFETSQDVYFSITLKDHLGVLKQVNTNTVSIQLPVDPGAISSNVGLVMEVDRPALTSAGTVTFSGYVFNDSGYKISEIMVTEATLGEIFSVSEMETGTKQSVSRTVDINETTTYNFVLTVKDRSGQPYTINADPIAVEIQAAATPSPTDISEGADTVTMPPENKAGDPLLVWIILAIVLLVLIAGVGVTIFILWKKGKSPIRRGALSGHSGPKPKSPKPLVRNTFSRPGGKSRSYKDRNNF